MELKTFTIEPFYKIDKEWALLTVGNKDKFNTMTVSWGGLGTLWSKPVVTVYVRPSRYTYQFMENNDYFTLSFYAEIHRKDMTILGSKSGRDIDKIKLTKLIPEYFDNYISFKQAMITIVCKKIYAQDLDKNKIPNNIKDNVYEEGEPAHKMYIGEVIDIIDKRE